MMFVFYGYFARHCEMALDASLAIALTHCEKAREFGLGSISQAAMACSVYALAGQRDSTSSSAFSVAMGWAFTLPGGEC
jgi:hypothetical protein